MWRDSQGFLSLLIFLIVRPLIFISVWPDKENEEKEKLCDQICGS
jgi:hypothetical protein